MEIDTHGLKMVGLDEAVAETKWLSTADVRRDGSHVQISYDVVTGEIYADYLTGGSYKRYHDHNIIGVLPTKVPMTAQEIADEIYYAVLNYRNAMEYVTEY